MHAKEIKKGAVAVPWIYCAYALYDVFIALRYQGLPPNNLTGLELMQGTLAVPWRVLLQYLYSHTFYDVEPSTGQGVPLDMLTI